MFLSTLFDSLINRFAKDFNLRQQISQTIILSITFVHSRIHRFWQIVTIRQWMSFSFEFNQRRDCHIRQMNFICFIWQLTTSFVWSKVDFLFNFSFCFAFRFNLSKTFCFLLVINHQLWKRFYILFVTKFSLDRKKSFAIFQLYSTNDLKHLLSIERLLQSRLVISQFNVIDSIDIFDSN